MLFVTRNLYRMPAAIHIASKCKVTENSLKASNQNVKSVNQLVPVGSTWIKAFLVIDRAKQMSY